MKKLSLFVICLTILALASNALAGTVISERSYNDTKDNSIILEEEKKKEVRKTLKHLKLPFIENRGQYDDRVSYTAKTFGGTLFVTKSGELVYNLPKIETEGIKTTRQTERNITGGVVVKERLIDAKVGDIKGVDKAETKVSYFKGNDPKDWKSEVGSYERVSLGEVYEGVRVELKARGSNVEKLFYVQAGADPSSIRLEVEGAKGIRVNDAGELVLDTGLGEVRFTRPIAYQEIDGKRVDVKVSYRIETNEVGAGLAPAYAFNVGQYDKGKELIIDPLLASTFLGGSGYDYGLSIALDSAGNVYVAGYTSSSNFPTTTGSYDTTYNGGGADVFVSKLSGDLTSLLASIFIGGEDYERGNSIALDNSGNVYVTGYTYSWNFPTTSGAYDRQCGNDGYCEFRYTDAFISKLRSDLKSLSASTFLGGSSNDSAYSIALDSSGNVYVTGETSSLNFPTTESAYDRLCGYDGNCEVSYTDVFVSKLNSDLTSLLASTYLGGEEYDRGHSIALDNSGNVYVTGYTLSADFPTTQGAYQLTSSGGVSDVFVSKLNSTLSQLSASTFLGGNGDDYGNAITIDSSGNVYVTGYTKSSDFPTTPVAYDTSHNGGLDVFVSRLDANLSASSSTYILTVTKSGTGSGTVTSSPAGINCGTDCSETYPTGTTVTLTATPSAGSTFAGWGGACSGTGTCTVTMASNKTVTATFNTIPCINSISPTSEKYLSLPATGSISVTAESNCSWTATSNDSWITITSGSSGTGSGTVSYTVAQNSTANERNGKITVLERTNTFEHTVNQIDKNFIDVDTNSWSFNYIFKLWQKYITIGCEQSPFRYCPDDPVTRGQMAAFIIRAKYRENFTYTPTPYFSDVPSTNTFFKYVQKLKDEGITSLSGTYYVNEVVDRGQMAAFISRAFLGMQ